MQKLKFCIQKFLLFFLTTTWTLSIDAGLILYPDTKDNPFFRDDPSLYIEDARQNSDQNDLNQNGKKLLIYLYL